MYDEANNKIDYSLFATTSYKNVRNFVWNESKVYRKKKVEKKEEVKRILRNKDNKNKTKKRNENVILREKANLIKTKNKFLFCKIKF